MKVPSLKQSHAELLSACSDLFGMIEAGKLVRDISGDASPEFTKDMMSFVYSLSKAQIAIAGGKAVAESLKPE